MSERLEKVESDIEAIALSIQDLSVRMSDLEGVGDIDGYTTSSLAELVALDDISSDSELAAEPPHQNDISSDIEPTAKTAPSEPLTQSALAKRLGCSDKAVQKHRQQDTKQQFAAWSRERDPDGIAWTWTGIGGRGQPLQFIPEG